MTGLITAIKRLSVHDGDGLRTTAFFKGCGLRCVWCHNPETLSFNRQIEVHKAKCVLCGECVRVCPSGSVKAEGGELIYDRSSCSVCGKCADACPVEARAVVGEEYTAEALAEKLKEDKPFFDNGGGVTLSGGECMLQADFALQVAKILHSDGVSVDIDTCGYAPTEAFERILPYVDTFLYDVKAIDPTVHEKCTGKNNELILKNLDFILSKGARVEVRIPLVPGYNDGEIDSIGRFLQGKGVKKVKVLAYHDLARSKYDSLGLADTMPRVAGPTAREVQKAVDELKSYGLNAVNGVLAD